MTSTTPTYGGPGSGRRKVYRAPRQEVIPVGRRGNPGGTVVQKTVIRRGAQPQEVLRNFQGGALRERQRGATDALGEVLLRKAKEYAPASSSPATSGNMRAGIRLVRLNANTVEIVAPPPALWRIRGFPETGGLRPWLVAGDHRRSVIATSTEHATRINRELRQAMREDYRIAARRHEIATELHQEYHAELSKEIEDISTAIQDLRERERMTQHPMTPQEANQRRAEIDARAREFSQEERVHRERAEGMQQRSAKGRVEMTERRQAQIDHHLSQANALHDQFLRLQQERSAVRAGRSIHHDPEMLRALQEQVPKLRGKQTGLIERRKEHEANAPQMPGEDEKMRKRGYPGLLRGNRYAAKVRQISQGLRSNIGGPTTRIPVLQYGGSEVRSATLLSILEGAFRYPEGDDFLAAAAADSEVQTMRDDLLRQMAEATTGGSVG